PCAVYARSRGRRQRRFVHPRHLAFWFAWSQRFAGPRLSQRRFLDLQEHRHHREAASATTRRDLQHLQSPKLLQPAVAELRRRHHVVDRSGNRTRHGLPADHRHPRRRHRQPIPRRRWTKEYSVSAEVDFLSQRRCAVTPKALANYSPGLERSDNPGLSPPHLMTNPERVHRAVNPFRVCREKVIDSRSGISKLRSWEKHFDHMT